MDCEVRQVIVRSFRIKIFLLLTPILRCTSVLRNHGSATLWNSPMKPSSSYSSQQNIHRQFITKFKHNVTVAYCDNCNTIPPVCLELTSIYSSPSKPWFSKFIISPVFPIKLFTVWSFLKKSFHLNLRDFTILMIFCTPYCLWLREKRKISSYFNFS